jgi:hypothetical protein
MEKTDVEACYWSRTRVRVLILVPCRPSGTSSYPHPASTPVFLCSASLHHESALWWCMYAWFLHPLSHPGLVFMIYLTPLVPILQCLVYIHLAPHQPRLTERRPMTLVDLPRMPRLRIEANHLFRRLRLELLPLIFVVSVVNWRWSDKHPGLTTNSWLCNSFCSSESRVRRYSTPISRADGVHRSWMGHCADLLCVSRTWHPHGSPDMLALVGVCAEMVRFDQAANTLLCLIYVDVAGHCAGVKFWNNLDRTSIQQPRAKARLRAPSKSAGGEVGYVGTD